MNEEQKVMLYGLQSFCGLFYVADSISENTAYNGRMVDEL
jgi:hypothetical protein